MSLLGTADVLLDYIDLSMLEMKQKRYSSIYLLSLLFGYVTWIGRREEDIFRDVKTSCSVRDVVSN